MYVVLSHHTVDYRVQVLQQILSWIETVDVTPPKKAANA